MFLAFLLVSGSCSDSSGTQALPSSLDDSSRGSDSNILSPNSEISLDCNVAMLEGELPLSISVDTSSGAEDDFSPGCAKGDTSGARDRGYYFEAPQSGYFSFEVMDSTFDSTVSLHEPDCEAKEIRCNDDSEGWQAHSRLVLPINAGEAMIVVVDGYEPADVGQGTLLVSMAEVLCEDGGDEDGDGLADCSDPDCRLAPTCMGQDCPQREFSGQIPETLRGTTSGDGMLGDATCSNGGNRGPEETFSFVAANSGKYWFDTIGSDFDTIVYVREHYCTGREIACDDDSGGDGTSRLLVELEAGQEIVVVVDGWKRDGGDFTLRVSGVEEACNDGIDNDNDGVSDCDDLDCVSIDCAFGGEWPESWSTYEEEMLAEVNLRRAAGATCENDVFPPAPAFEMNDYLRLSARLHSLDMSNQNYFEHEGLDGRSPDERIHDAGFMGSYPTGENISAGYVTAAASVEGLMNSPGHCRNIMNPEFSVIGLGFSYNRTSDFGEYWTQNFGGSH